MTKDQKDQAVALIYRAQQLATVGKCAADTCQQLPEQHARAALEEQFGQIERLLLEAASMVDGD